MATKKGKKAGKTGKAAKGGKATRKVVAKGTGEARPRETIANFIRDQLGKGVDPAKIVEKAQTAFPDKKPTVGYVNWVKEHAPKVSTTTSSAAV